MNKLGCILTDKYTEKNYDFGMVKNNISFAPIIPPEFINDKCRILNQGNIGSCVAHMLGESRILKEQEQLQNNKEYSIKWIYYNRKPNHYQGEGMIIEEALSQLACDGVPEYSEYEGNDTYANKPNNFEEIKSTLLEKAKPHRISSFYEIKTEDLEQKIKDIKLALLFNGSVGASIQVRSSFYEEGKNGGNIKDFKPDETNYGGHAVLIIGWTLRGEWIVQNSWGENWGDNGLCYIPMVSNVWKKFFVIIDTITDKEINLDYVLVLENSMYDTKESAENSCIGFNSNWFLPFSKYKYKVFQSNNKFFVGIDEVFQTRLDAKNFKQNCDLKTMLNIIPTEKKLKYYCCFNYEFSSEIADMVIKDLSNNEMTKVLELQLEKINHKNNYKVSVKSSYNKKELEDFILSVKDILQNLIIIES